MIELGDKVQDNVSRLEGIAVSEIRYLNHCHQFGVQSEYLKESGKMPSVEYIDVGQLLLMEKQVVVITEEEDPGGAQAYAPVKK